ncbi:CLUMA_CG014171, isoform A [Clunio marinus]|uniref:Evolutionarily conserved signaling intermediate in Toll pathway, mitochondrial n=1 Tax=Clunio marinus TaxID=568069 RepID=A0A1J1IRF5_9DIPT|nr:CLUMA_CG014171, isoform A [Clunio marinus]
MIRCKNCFASFVTNRLRLQRVFQLRQLCTSNEKSEEQKESEQIKREKSHEQFMKQALILKGSFEYVATKDKGNYLEMIKIFENKDVHRRNHVEFIYAALKNMEEFNVHKDLQVYKALIDVMPKGKFIPQNLFQAEFMHYPKQQQCMIDLLEQMEDNGVMPDYEMEDMLVNIFGRRGHPVRKFWRMMYWMPKFKNLSPWVVPNPPPQDAFELAQLAVERMCSVDVESVINIYNTEDVEDSVDHTWIVSGQSPEQKELLTRHPIKSAVYIEGPFLIWLRDKSINYFILRGDLPSNRQPVYDEDEYDDVSHIDVPLFGFGKPKKNKLIVKPSIHEQSDGIIYAVCCTGMSTKDSLLSWIRLLEKDGNPTIKDLAILFKFKSPADKELVTT